MWNCAVVWSWWRRLKACISGEVCAAVGLSRVATINLAHNLGRHWEVVCLVCRSIHDWRGTDSEVASSELLPLRLLQVLIDLLDFTKRLVYSARRGAKEELLNVRSLRVDAACCNASLHGLKSLLLARICTLRRVELNFLDRLERLRVGTKGPALTSKLVLVIWRRSLNSSRMTALVWSLLEA